jgi:hypothetical protein
VRGVLTRAIALLLAWGLTLPLAAAGIRERQDQRRQERLETELRQLLFGKALVSEARRHLGRPYLWGGKSGQGGFDCSGYTAAVYGALGVPLAAGAQAQLMQGASVPRTALQAGDLLFFHGRGSPYHVDIYEGGGRFLHAPGTGKLIQSTALTGAWTGRRWIGARRHAPPPIDSTTTTPQRERAP